MNTKGFNAVMMACLWIVLAFMYIPIIAIIGMSFNATAYGMFPYVFTTDWYVTLFTDSNLLPACWYSLKFSFAVTLAAVVIGTMTSSFIFLELAIRHPRIFNTFNYRARNRALDSLYTEIFRFTIEIFFFLTILSKNFCFLI